MRAWAAGAALIFASGCGGPTPVQRRANVADEPASERRVDTGESEVVRRGPDREPAWSAKSASARLSYGGEGNFGGRFEDVSGLIFSEGKPASEFKARAGVAEQESETLILEGSVRIVGIESKATLSAMRVQWRPDRKLVLASGDVRVNTPDYSIGPFPSLLATPDLRQFGTPDTFPPASRPSKSPDGAN